MINKFNERYDIAVKCDEQLKTSFCGKPTNIFLSEADTFIEYAFERACAQVKDGMITLNEWRIHKEQYIKLTETTIYDFEHFSRHDASHSITILETIVMVVGEARIVKLSRGDLWLLLEAAYSHDIGMALTGDELCELWKNDEFRKYLLSCLHSNEVEMGEAANAYQQMDNLIHGHLQMNDMEGQKRINFEDCWPACISNYVEWLITGYIRRNHAARNKIVRKRIITLKETSIPTRLYDYIVLICGLHTKEFKEIFVELPREMKGIGEELVHPQFTAVMLRLGDVLDMESNRFSIYAMEHMLKVPPLSMVHYGKHKAVRKIQITPKKIELTAESDQIKVCRETSNWFRMVEDEVNKVIIHWNKIVPKQLRGCRLRPSKCTVYHITRDGQRERKAEYWMEDQRHFEIDKDKFLKLVEGLNIYNRIDFIREYIQNALDASKVQMWIDLKRHKYDEALKKGNMKELMPYDIPKSVYEKYEVRLTIEMNVPKEYEKNGENHQKNDDFRQARIIIKDHGIGMERECLDVISCIGAGWKKRKKYSDELGKMPKWLRPTGGFGIGLQSAFMVSDCVEIHTQAQDESAGRHIIMRKQEMGGVIDNEECFTTERGTQMTINVPISELLAWNTHLKSADSKQSRIQFNEVYAENGVEDFFGATSIGRYIFRVIGEYLHKIIPDSILPVKIVLKGFGNQILESAFWNPLWWREQKNAWEIEQKESVEIKWEGNTYQVFAQKEGRGVCFWDRTNEVHACIGWIKSNERDIEKSIVCYKSIRMTEPGILELPMYQGYFLMIDYMGLDASRDLRLNRNEFTEEAKRRHLEYLKQCVRLFMHLLTLYKGGEETKKEKLLSLEYRTEPDFVRSRILFSAKEDWSELEKEVAALCEGEQKDDYVIGKKRLLTTDLSDLSNGETIEEVLSVCYGNGNDGADRKVSLLEFMKDYHELLSDETGNAIFLLDGRLESKKLERKETSLQLPAIRKLISEMDGHRNVETSKLAKEYIAKLRAEGAYVYPELLLKIHSDAMFEEVPITMQIDKSNPCGVTAIKKQKNICMMANDFYLRSYTNGGNKGRMVWKEAECPDEYLDLLVKGMPWQQSGSREEAVLLSPIPEAFRKRLEENLYYNMMAEQTILEEEEFMAVLTAMEEYQFVVSYVAGNPKNDTLKGNIDEISKLYESYARKIWMAVFAR